MAAERDRDEREYDANEDPITGEPGAHPVGAGLGAAVGGAAAGAAAGAVAGPVGAAVGIVAGGLAGGYAGKEIAERIDPTAEEEYWRREYPNRDYYEEGIDYDQIGPAYRHGWESRVKHHPRGWEEVETEVEEEWPQRRGDSQLDWERARPATRDAWDRVDLAVRGSVGETADPGEQGQLQDTPSRRPK